MRRLVWSLLAVALAGASVATACGGGTPPGPTGEAAADDRVLLAHLGRLATERVRDAAPGATLQQVDIVPGEGRYTFRFADAAAQRVVSTTGGVGAQAAADFTLGSPEPLGSLAGPPGEPLDLATLRVGPDGVVTAAVEALGAATPRTLVLARRDGRPVWRAVVNGPKGIVSGTVPDETGRFRPDAP